METKTRVLLPRLMHQPTCRAHAYRDNDMCNCTPMNLDHEIRDAWVAERLPDLLAKHALQDKGVLIQRLQDHWETLQLQGRITVPV